MNFHWIKMCVFSRYITLYYVPYQNKIIVIWYWWMDIALSNQHNIRMMMKTNSRKQKKRRSFNKRARYNGWHKKWDENGETNPVEKPTKNTKYVKIETLLLYGQLNAIRFFYIVIKAAAHFRANFFHRMMDFMLIIGQQFGISANEFVFYK